MKNVELPLVSDELKQLKIILTIDITENCLNDKDRNGPEVYQFGNLLAAAIP